MLLKASICKTQKKKHNPKHPRHHTTRAFSSTTSSSPSPSSPGGPQRVFHRVEADLNPPKLDKTHNIMTGDPKKRWAATSRPNPTLQKIAQLNAKLTITPRAVISDDALPSTIPNLNDMPHVMATESFRTDPIADRFDHSLAPHPSTKQQYRHNGGPRNGDDGSIDADNKNNHNNLIPPINKQKHRHDNNNDDDDDGGDDYADTTLSGHYQRYKSKLDQEYQYRDQPDSALYEAEDAFAEKRAQRERKREVSKQRAANFKTTPEERRAELEQQREEDLSVAEGLDFEPINQEVTDNIVRLQSLSAYIMQNKAEAANFHPAQRPVFWHGVIPHTGNAAIQGLEDFKQTVVDLDWRTFLDLSQPHLWYPTARLLKRKIILHCGPTNSGKTYRAMQRLKEAQSGLYCGPLRLLAWENYEKLNNQNVGCSLLTGQEVVEIPDAKHVSSTVEMVNLDRIVDVAVIDEIQMIQDRDRGHAWTRAFLGVPAKEVHLCGDATSLSWLQEMTKITGEELHVCEYKRLSPLAIQDQPVTSYKYLKKGDCVVAFSRNEVYSLKKKIEQETNRKVSIIYGNLPPEIRKEQARSFNDGESDILVASDAIGMGLNLNIGRVVFSTIMKFDGEEYRRLAKTEVLQIAGRAGRFNTQFHQGQVSVMHVPEDLEYIRQQFETPLPPMSKAQLFPSTDHLLAFCERFPDVKLSDYLRSLATRAKVGPLFEVSDVRNIADLAEVCDDIPMPSYNRVMLSYIPLNIERYKSHRPLLIELATQLNGAEPIPVPKVAYCARPVMPRTTEEVALLEETFSNLEAYIWLWFRMGDQMYMHKRAKLDRESCQKIILQYLQTNSHVFTKHRTVDYSPEAENKKNRIALESKH